MSACQTRSEERKFMHRDEDDLPFGHGDMEPAVSISSFKHGRETYRQAEEAVKRSVHTPQMDAFGLDALVRLRMLQGFRSHVEIARAMASVVRDYIDIYRDDQTKFTRSLGCCSGLEAVHMVQAARRETGTTKGICVYVSGWMIAAVTNVLGPMPDQSIQPSDAVPNLVREIYTHLRKADEVALNDLFDRLGEAKANGDDQASEEIIREIDDFDSHIVPIIVDIDAGYGDAMATQVLARACIEAGASCIQIENQESAVKQCGHQAGKVIVPPDVSCAKLRAVRLAALSAGCARPCDHRENRLMGWAPRTSPAHPHE